MNDRAAFTMQQLPMFAPANAGSAIMFQFLSYFKLYPSVVSHIIREHRDISSLSRHGIHLPDRDQGPGPPEKVLPGDQHICAELLKEVPEGSEDLACLCTAGCLADPDHLMTPLVEDVI